MHNVRGRRDKELPMQDQDFEGRVALVTGSTGGVGFEVARRLAERGATVVINGRSVASGEAALARLRGQCARVHLAVGDCGDAAQAARVVREAGAVAGRLDIVVSAGAQGSVPPKPFAEMTAEEIVQAHQSRFLPRIFPVHAAVPLLREHGGSVVMLGTDAARHPTPGESVVGAVGAGVILMTKALAKEFSRWRIRVNGVAMTLTSGTTSWDRIFGGGERFQAHLFGKLNERFPSGRAPTVEEVAAVVVFLASDAAAQVTGQTVSVNGGLSFGGW
jgi:3-oxoacyl-[acyl-carrier protein] reductase